ncbi:MAG: hypothetical protein K8T25_07085 [Planctomycetia bacterium]|nr:hypothetical protein [Planctomycetia bacterium]
MSNRNARCHGYGRFKETYKLWLDCELVEWAIREAVRLDTSPGAIMAFALQRAMDDTAGGRSLLDLIEAAQVDYRKRMNGIGHD